MPTKKKEKLIILDGHALIYRAWFALPPLTTKSGEVVNAIYGFTATLLKVIKDMKPTYLAVALDEKGPTFRHVKYAAYKATREVQPDDFYNQIPRIKDVLKSLSVTTLAKKGYEADDIIGSLVHTFKKENDLDIIIITKDFDIYQLIDGNVHILDFEKGISEFKEITKKELKEKYELTPEQIIDYKALRGDPSDNIKGVPGVGDKTAREIVKKFGDIETLYKKLPQIKKTKRLPAGVIDKLEEFKKDAFDSKELVTLKTDLPIKQKLSSFELKPIDTTKAYELFREFEFRSLIPRLSILGAIEKKETTISPGNYATVKTKKEVAALISKLEKKKLFAFDTETSGINPLLDKLVGISISCKEKEAYWIPKETLDQNKKSFEKIFAANTIKKIAHNLKFDLAVLRTYGFELDGLFFDTLISAQLLANGTREQGLKDLVFIEFGDQMTKIEELIGTGKKQITMADVPEEQLIPYACADADYAFRLYSIMEERLSEKKLDDVFYTMEMPLVPILEQMERGGITLDENELSLLNKKVSKQLDKLTDSIYDIAGQEFNINSPKQLKEILFEKLQIPSDFLRSTKTGISTAASELNKLRHQHPIVEMILNYRELYKLQSTYLEPLPELINPKTKRVHTTYNQIGAATGRFSSNNPNLQNIPIRTELGNQIRKAFVAGKGNALLAADYSQIELRIAAHLAKDRNMINAFKKNADIHRETAAVINDVKESDVTSVMRFRAKEVNFGVLFGMNAFGLAMRTGISPHEAQEFLDKYFDYYSGLRDYLKNIIIEAREQGYVESMFGRRRYLPDIRAKNPQIRLAAERMALNMPIQGTEADIIKLAMIEIDKQLISKNEKINFSLQVHDELVLEVPKKDVTKAAKVVEKAMNSVVKLSTPITTKISAGPSWFDLKEL